MINSFCFPVLSYKKTKNYISLLLCLVSITSCEIFRRKPSENISFRTNLYTKKVITTARTYTGVAYKSGGNSISGLDCSGLLCLSFKEIGVKLPRISWQQADFFPEITGNEIKKGDLVFFVTVGKNISHSGIITEVNNEKDIRFIHASSSKGVIEDNLKSNYWQSRLAKICRPPYSNFNFLSHQ